MCVCFCFSCFLVTVVLRGTIHAPHTSCFIVQYDFLGYPIATLPSEVMRGDKVLPIAHRPSPPPLFPSSLPHPFPLQALLLPGRHLQYSVDDPSPSDERHFATLVRFPPDAPSGVATALLNWKGGTLEVWPCESVLLALLLCAAVAEAVNEMVGVNRLRPFARVPLPPRNPEHHWGAVLASGNKAGKGEEEREEREDFVFSNIEDGRSSWWNRRPLKWAPGAANCGAGACGPSTVELLSLF